MGAEQSEKKIRAMGTEELKLWLHIAPTRIGETRLQLEGLGNGRSARIDQWRSLLEAELTGWAKINEWVRDELASRGCHLMPDKAGDELWQNMAISE